MLKARRKRRCDAAKLCQPFRRVWISAGRGQLTERVALPAKFFRFGHPQPVKLDVLDGAVQFANVRRLKRADLRGEGVIDHVRFAPLPELTDAAVVADGAVEGAGLGCVAAAGARRSREQKA